MSKDHNIDLTVEALKKGDHKVFETVYLTYYQKLVVFLNGYTSDQNIIEDVIQDLFLRLWKNRKKLSIKSSIGGYLYKMAYNTLMGKYRNLKRKNELLSSFYYTALVQNTEIDHEFKNTLLDKLEICIENLPERCKLVFIEKKIKGLKYLEVAERFNISIKTVEGHMTRALASLKKCLKPV